MLTLQKTFSQLRVVVGAAAENAVRCLCAPPPVSKQSLLPAPSRAVSAVCAQWYSTRSAVKTGQSQGKTYNSASPYKNPGPRRYGYDPHFFTDGLLPRGTDRPMRSLPTYKHKDVWDRKRALFGQNDYIDILGDGSVRPVDLLHGPDWLIGFKGNELQRLIRRLKFHSDKLKLLYPTKYHNIRKRIFFLHKKYNKKRGTRVTGQ